MNDRGRQSDVLLSKYHTALCHSYCASDGVKSKHAEVTEKLEQLIYVVLHVTLITTPGLFTEKLEQLIYLLFT